MKLPLLAAFCSIAILGAAPAQDPFADPLGNPLGSDGPVMLRATWSAEAARPGDHLVMAVIADVEEGWHINPDAAQSFSVDDFDPLPTVVTVKAPPELVTLETPIFPAPHPVEVEFSSSALMSLDGEVVIFVGVKVSEQAEVGEAISFDVSMFYQTCNDRQCLEPATIETDVTLEIVAPGTAVAKQNEDLFASYGSAASAVGFDLFGLRFAIDASSSMGLILLLLVAMLGGVLLNFTPCVLPVIPIKIMSLSKVAGHRSRCLALGTSMAAGVVGFWLGLGVLISAVSGFTATNQLFQYPAFTISIGVVIGALAIGMCGLFSVRLPNFVYGITPKQETHGGSFGLGIMTAVLSTPCTAPFMGAAAAWAAGQAPVTTLATFTAIGLGMALPYLVLAAFPALVKAMPQTGPASVLIKQVMGLFLLAAAAYFVGTGLSGLLVTPPDPPSRLHWWPVMILCAIAGGWMAWRALRITPSLGRRTVFGVLGVVVVVASAFGGASLTGKGPVDWVYYTEERFQAALADDKVVVMDFTAEWCLNCKALEHSVLYSDDVVQLMNADDVVPMKVDITGNNPAGKQKLNDVKSLTIPLLVIFDSNGNQVFRSDAYTIDNVVDAITKAK